MAKGTPFTLEHLLELLMKAMMQSWMFIRVKP